MAAGPSEVLEKDLGCPEATEELPRQAGSAQRRPRKDGRKDTDTAVSSDGESGRAHGLEEARTRLGVSEQDPDEPELSMPEPAPLGGDKKAAEKKRVEKVGAKGSTSSPPVPKSLPVQRKVEPPSLDPAEEPLLWEGLTLNKCILVASVVALLSVTFQVLQAPCSREGISRGRQDPPPPPLHEVVSTKEEVQEVVTAQPPQLESSMVEADDGDDDGGDDGEDDDEADSNLAEPWIFKKWFGRSAPKHKDEDEDENEDEDDDKEPVDVPEVPPVVMEVKKSREKKLEKKEEKVEKEEKAREGRAAQAERSSRREARAKDRPQGEKPSRAPRAPREPEQQPQRKRGREGKESRRERDEPRKEGWKGRPGRTDGGRESPKRDWRQQKGKKPWEPVASPGKEGTTRSREGKRRD
ncbi:junctional sarcoplasmic reticulum protein 1 [Numenius arquata]|uniref:junctional sarcoplasmic reticulum protein 1 n=1 Tax=Numenius arquata TaxID=31919 RepID=UPI003D30BCF3